MGTLASIFVAVNTLLFLGSLPTDSQSINGTTLVTMVYPMMNQYLPVNSGTNVTFNCSVDSNFSIVWSVGRTQISHADQFPVFMNLGYTIEPMNTDSRFSMITVSVTDRSTTIECLPFKNRALACGDCSEEYSVVPFDSPSAPTNLQLSPLPSLTLVWSRPSVPAITEVPTYYTVEINATEDSRMNFTTITSNTYLSVQFLEDMLPDFGSDCVEFEFFVSATNNAGTGPLARIQDTVPISPDVRNIDQELRVTRVDVLSHTAQISFPPVEPCGVNFSLTNYTINIDGAVHHILTPGDVTPGVPLTISNLTQDASSSLTVTACNDVTCRTSESRTLNTTDVQTVEAVFFENRLFLNCSFAVNSLAQGCVFNFTLISANPIPVYNLSRDEGFVCTEAPYRRDAYSDVFVMDWEESGENGNVPLNITNIIVSASTLNEFVELTGCPEVLPNTGGQQGLSRGGVGGVVTAVLVVFIVLVVAVIITVCFAIKKYFSRYEHFADVELQNSRGMAGGPPPPPGRASKVEEKLRFTKQERIEDNETHSEYHVYGCEVETGECEELLKNFESLLEPKQSDASSDLTSVAKNPVDSKENKVLQTTRLEYRDADTPLTLKIHWKSLFESLLASSEPLRDQMANKKFNFTKLKVQLEF